MYFYLDYQSEPVAIHDLDALSQLVDANSLCRACGQSHTFQPDFEGVKTSIDDIAELFRRRLHNV